jgi:hypothetical protein
MEYNYNVAINFMNSGMRCIMDIKTWMLICRYDTVEVVAKKKREMGSKYI